jgi:hypothetical protein
MLSRGGNTLVLLVAGCIGCVMYADRNVQEERDICSYKKEC